MGWPGQSRQRGLHRGLFLSIKDFGEDLEPKNASFEMRSIKNKRALNESPFKFGDIVKMRIRVEKREGFS